MFNIDSGGIVPVLTIWREARGEGQMGMLAVACVIRNRVIKRRLTASQVCAQPWQFSSMTAKGDPELLVWPADNDASFLAAYEQWMASLSAADPTHGADFYFADGIPMPSWAKAYTFTATIGRQHFYRS